MKAFCVVALVILGSSGASAQHRAAAPAMPSVPRPAALSPQRIGSAGTAAPFSPVPSAGALGGSFASSGISHPLGGVALPTFPSSLGTPQRRHQPNQGYRYVGPVYYVPNAFDTSYQPSGYSTFNQPANPALNYAPGPLSGDPGQPQQPIIVNQYFGSRNSTTTEDGTSTTETAPPPPNSFSPGQPGSAQINPGDPLGTPQHYYLIAYRNHSIYSALAYWLEGDTLHYVTTQNTHNQASLTLIDLEQTTKLNADNSVPFTLAGK